MFKKCWNQWLPITYHHNIVYFRKRNTFQGNKCWQKNRSDSAIIGVTIILPTEDGAFSLPTTGLEIIWSEREWDRRQEPTRRRDQIRTPPPPPRNRVPRVFAPRVIKTEWGALAAAQWLYGNSINFRKRQVDSHYNIINIYRYIIIVLYIHAYLHSYTRHSLPGNFPSTWKHAELETVHSLTV